MLKTRHFDIAELLETEQDIQAFLTEASQSGDSAEFVRALGIAARAKGMTEVAKQAGVTRASLYKSLDGDGNPEFGTVAKVCMALGFRLVPQQVKAHV